MIKALWKSCAAIISAPRNFQSSSSPPGSTHVTALRTDKAWHRIRTSANISPSVSDHRRAHTTSPGVRRHNDRNTTLQPNLPASGFRSGDPLGTSPELPTSCCWRLVRRIRKPSWAAGMIWVFVRSPPGTSFLPSCQTGCAAQAILSNLKRSATFEPAHGLTSWGYCTVVQAPIALRPCLMKDLDEMGILISRFACRPPNPIGHHNCPPRSEVSKAQLLLLGV